MGVPADELPLAPADMAPTRRTRKLLKHIFISGNFGRFDANGRDHSEVPYLNRKWRSGEVCDWDGSVGSKYFR